MVTPKCNASAKVVGKIRNQNLHTNINASSVLVLVLVTGFSWIISWDIASCVKSVPLFLLVGSILIISLVIHSGTVPPLVIVRGPF